MTTPNLSLPELIQNQTQPHVPVNAALRIIDALVQGRVLDIDLTAPPGSPANGDAYIPASPATGDWAGHEDDIAYYNAGWQFVTPKAGWRVFVDDEGVFYAYGLGSPPTWETGELTINDAIVAITALFTASPSIRWEISSANQIQAFVKPAVAIVTEAGSARDLTAADLYSYIRCTNGAGCVVTVPSPGTDEMELGGVVNFYGLVTFTEEDTSVAINVPEGFQAKTRSLSSQASLINVAEGEFDLSGDLEPVP